MLILEDLQNFVNKYPDFQLYEWVDSYSLIGLAKIIGTNGDILDQYNIKIELQKTDYPHKFPVLIETENRIPKNPDWHIFPDGSCCVAVAPIILIEENLGLKIGEYYTRFVIPYLANQTYRFETGNFVEEYSHGISGIYEYYENLFETKDLSVAFKYLQIIINKQIPHRSNSCFCGSGKKYRHCHKEIIISLQRIGLKNVFIHLEKYIRIGKRIPF